MTAWRDIPLDAPVFQNVVESALRSGTATLENAFVTEQKGHSRFPGLSVFSTLAGNRPVALNSWAGDLIAVPLGGRVYRIDQSGTKADMTGTAVRGDQRAIFAKTEAIMVICAGGPIIQYTGTTTLLLSADAPESTHVVFVDGYLIAIEPHSGRFYYSDPGEYETWNPLSVFTAEGKPDDLVAAAVSPYNELLLCGPDSIEEFIRVTSGDQPFARRYVSGQGLSVPYSLVTIREGNYGMSENYEFVRFSGQQASDQSDQIQMTLDDVDDWSNAWAAELPIKGQKFIVIQAPLATNAHGTKGVTLLYDVKRRRWSSLYGWDSVKQIPTLWPGRSVFRLWGRTFIGGDGAVYEMTDALAANAGAVQRMVGRTAHADFGSPASADKLRVRLTRGVGSQANASTPPEIMLRLNKDNLGFGGWMRKSLGAPGKRNMVIEFDGPGLFDTLQIEYQVTDAVPVDIHKIQVNVTLLEH